MKRSTLFIASALIIFFIGSLVAVNYFYSKPNARKQETRFEMSQVNGKWQLVAAEEFSPLNKESKTEKFDKKLREPFCEDTKILPVWKSILEDISAGANGVLLLREANCSKLLEVKEIDLNNDGRKEILLRGSYDFCLWNGNCAFWVFASKQNGYKKLLYGNDYIEITEMGEQVRSTKSADFKDLVLTEHINSSDTAYTTFKFNGTKYTESKCEVEACFGCIGKIAEWETVSCSKYDQMP